MRSPGCQRDERRKDGRSEEWGFTLPELLATIAIIGIVAAIAIPSFFGLIEARRVESAANQLASDLRLAHSRATNQVGTEWKVTLHPGVASQDDPDYTLVGSESSDRTLPGNVRITSPSSAGNLMFSANGSMTADFPPASTPATPDGGISVSNSDGQPQWKINVTPTTSDVEIEKVSS